MELWRDKEIRHGAIKKQIAKDAARLRLNPVPQLSGPVGGILFALRLAPLSEFVNDRLRGAPLVWSRMTFVHREQGTRLRMT